MDSSNVYVVKILREICLLCIMGVRMQINLWEILKKLGSTK